MIRGELLKKYPTAVIYANRADWEYESDGHTPDLTKPRKLVPLAPGEEDKPPPDKVRMPLYEAKADPDIYFFGFDLTVPEAKGGTGHPPDTDPGWFFVIKERPGEPRFGLELTRDANPEVLDELTWDDALPGGAPGEFLSAGNLDPVSLTHPPGGDPEEKLPPVHGRRTGGRRCGERRALGLPALPPAGDGRDPRRRDARRRSRERLRLHTRRAGRGTRRCRGCAARGAAGRRRRRGDRRLPRRGSIRPRPAQPDPNADGAAALRASAREAAAEAKARGRRRAEGEGRGSSPLSSMASPRSPIRAAIGRPPDRRRPARALPGADRDALQERSPNDEAAPRHQLWVRIYPDDCSIDTFEPTLSTTEVQNAKRYWQGIWRAGGVEDDERAAWRDLVAAHGSGRAGFDRRRLPAGQLGDRPTKASPPTRSSSSRPQTPLVRGGGQCDLDVLGSDLARSQRRGGAGRGRRARHGRRRPCGRRSSRPTTCPSTSATCRTAPRDQATTSPCRLRSSSSTPTRRPSRRSWSEARDARSSPTVSW